MPRSNGTTKQICAQAQSGSEEGPAAWGNPLSEARTQAALFQQDIVQDWARAFKVTWMAISDRFLEGIV